MRRTSALVIAASGCGVAAPPVRVPAAAPAPVATSSAREAPNNTLGVVVAPLLPPISEASVHFVAPSAGERVALGDARRYDVRWSKQQLDSDSLGIDVALDGHRPRRVPASASLITLGLLVPADEQLSAGEHWLFAAPISASGLVPRRADGAPGSAVAVRFLIGEPQPGPATAGGAIWLRKPEGTYNGSSSEQVLFDAHVFRADGAPLGAACRIFVRGRLTGELELGGPSSVLALASGDYELSASAPGAAPAPARVITVNSELGRPK